MKRYQFKSYSVKNLLGDMVVMYELYDEIFGCIIEVTAEDYARKKNEKVGEFYREKKEEE